MIDIHNELIKAFPNEATSGGRSVYFEVGKAVGVVKFCQTNGWAVIGLEGFHLDGNDLVPDLGFIADFTGTTHTSSWSDYVQLCATGAETVLNRWVSNPALMVELVVKTEADSEA
jgi:hypothetical protein